MPVAFKEDLLYCTSLTTYGRRKSLEVPIGDVPLGAHHPVRVQSMTTVDTMDTKGSVEQAIRMIEAGSEYVRLTAPSLNEAQNLENIKKELRKRGYQTPLIADIHFTPNAAELAARIVEKVRINPGNFADRKKFQVIEYTESEYNAELDRIREKFVPLLKICKEYGTALRIGTNHGSLSDRIMSRYGDTPLGMVESALEFLRVCEDENYYQVVLSMKASNPQVMVHAYRMLVQRMDVEGLQPYPLHLGVTEAGEGEDGRIKSAVGIGTLMEDGLGDTIRVSLTEEPEFEIPVAILLVNRYKSRTVHDPIQPVITIPVDPYVYNRRKTKAIENFGAKNVPRVIADFSGVKNISVKDLASIGHRYLETFDKWVMDEIGADYIYTGNHKIDFMLPNGLRCIQNYDTWLQEGAGESEYPLFTVKQFTENCTLHPKLNFVQCKLGDLTIELLEKIKKNPKVVLVAFSDNLHAMAELRRAFFVLLDTGMDVPLVIRRNYSSASEEEFQVYASTDAGALMLEGMGDGIWLSYNRPGYQQVAAVANSTSFGILQASRTRITRTEYISCPSCGRTLFDLQKTTAKIRERTDHLKGVKIAIMGCIVNGPGEMADADYGYVGAGIDKITLYKGKEVVKKGIPFDAAVDELITLIKNGGDWVDT